MAFPTKEAVDRFRALLEGDNGMAANLAALASSYGMEQGSGIPQKLEYLHAPAEMHEKASAPKGPVIQVYCDQIECKRTERLRPFSGRLRLVTEVRVSQDRLEGVTERLHYYVDALRAVIENNAGCAGPGLYLDGEYEVKIEPVRKGGLNFLQAAKISCWAMLNRS